MVLLAHNFTPHDHSVPHYHGSERITHSHDDHHYHHNNHKNDDHDNHNENHLFHHYQHSDELLVEFTPGYSCAFNLKTKTYSTEFSKKLTAFFATIEKPPLIRSIYNPERPTSLHILPYYIQLKAPPALAV